MTDEKDEKQTLDGMKWPIVLVVELAGAEVDALTNALQGDNVIVLTEGSMVRAAVHVLAQKPQVVVAPASLPAARTQTLRDAAEAAATEVVFVGPGSDVSILLQLVTDALARVSKRSQRKQRATRPPA
jgi:2-phospho-L-lactate guanylyltransferase (CobY/MobA/RfbA family)